jgi:hypothetical protein
MLNSDLVLQAADDLAERLNHDYGSDLERIEQLYERACGRPATALEAASGAKFLADAERLLATSELNSALRRRRAWAALCQTVLAANEFAYVK